MLKLKQYFCSHHHQFIGKHRYAQQNLWQCKKCDVFIIEHFGIGLSYACKTPNIDNWNYAKK